MTKLTGEWLFSEPAQKVMRMLEDAGHQIYAVGGCVRNELLGVPVSDVDMSTDALPAEVVKLSKLEGLKPVPTGIDHGTITVVADGEAFEITTFRADVSTDGRRAVVRFSKDIGEDAIRRDFTMNALYADRSGQLVDPLNGLPDLQAKRLRFIQDANKRIQEDYLRTLRFFRFFAWYGDPDQGMEPDALAAIAANLGGLESLSKERVGSELLKLLSANDPSFSLAAMAQSGVLQNLLPGTDTKAMAPLVHFEQELGLNPDPIRRLAALGEIEQSDLRLSSNQVKSRDGMRDAIGNAEPISSLAYRHGEAMAFSVAALRSAVFEQPLPAGLGDDIRHAAKQVFPVSAKDLMPDYSGPALGEALRKLEADWIASGFAIPKDRLISSLGG